MSKQHKILLLLALTVACVGITLFFALKARERKKQDDETSGIVFPVSYGDRGEQVRKLQQAANEYMRRYPTAFTNLEALAEDGIWGEKTENVLYAAFGISGSVSEEKYKAIIALIE
jgi:hypothetical protein